MNKSIFIILIMMVVVLNGEDIILNKIEVNANNINENEEEVLHQKDGYMKNAPMQKQITSKQALEIAGTNGDPLKAMKTFAGVVTSNNDDNSELYIHGSKPRETSYSINHLPIGYLFHLGGLHSVISPEMTGQIDAYLGGFDVTYNAMGAVVDITPKYPIGNNKGRVHIGMYDADFAFDAKLGENTDLFIGARRSYFDLIATKVLDEVDKDDSDKKRTVSVFPQFYDAQLLLTHQANNNIYSLEMITMRDQVKLTDSFNIKKDPIAVGKINIDIKSNTIGTRWMNISDNRVSNTLLYKLTSVNNTEFFDANFFLKAKFENYGIFHESVFDFKNHKVTIGSELKFNTVPINAHFTNISSTDEEIPLTLQNILDINKTYKQKEYTIFSQDIWDITPKDHFRYGARVWKTDYNNFGNGIDPRIAYTHDFENNYILSLSLGKYSQLPSMIRTIHEFGNPKLSTTESSYHYTLGVKKIFKDKSSLLIEPYYKKFKNLAITDDINNYEGVGKGKAYGIDVTYKKNINNLNVMLAYSYVKATRQLSTDKNKQYSFEGDVPHTLQMTLNYRFNKKYRISAYAKYSSGTPYTPIISTQQYTYKGKEYIKPVYGEQYSKRLDPNYDLDIQIGRTTKYLNNRSLEMTFELMNVNALFKKNVSSIKYNDKYEKDGYYEQIGFLPAFHFTYRF